MTRVRPVLPERLRARLVGAKCGVWVTTADGCIVFWNRAAEATLGYRAQEAIGRHCADVITGRDQQQQSMCGIGCHRSAGITAFERSFGVPARTKAGGAVWLEVMALATGDEHSNGDGAPAFVVHVFHDATSSHELLRAIRKDFALGTTGCEACLTPREAEVLRLMAQGCGTATVAKHLRISRATTRNHVQNIFGKLRVHTRLRVVLKARARDLL